MRKQRKNLTAGILLGLLRISAGTVEATGSTGTGPEEEGHLLVFFTVVVGSGDSAEQFAGLAVIAFELRLNSLLKFQLLAAQTLRIVGKQFLSDHQQIIPRSVTGGSGEITGDGKEVLCSHRHHA